MGYIANRRDDVEFPVVSLRQGSKDVEGPLFKGCRTLDGYDRIRRRGRLGEYFARGALLEHLLDIVCQ